MPNETDAVITKRPALIWITQALALAIGITAIFGACKNAIAWLTGSLPWATVTQLVASLLVQGLLGGMILFLFVGLIKPRAWARWGSVIFAICLFILYLVVKHRMSVTPDVYTPSEQVGAAIAEIVLVFTLALYPTRLYYSKAVRKFFGMVPHERV
jgi:hypothetical protein